MFCEICGKYRISRLPLTREVACAARRRERKRPSVRMVFLPYITSFVHPDSVCVAINPLHFINKGKYDLLLFLAEMGPALKELLLGIG